MRQRVLFKIAVLVFQCLAGQAPSYLSDDCQPVSDSRLRRLRSSDALTCVVRRAHNTYGDRCFATAGPRVWNLLPAELQSCDSLRHLNDVWRHIYSGRRTTALCDALYRNSLTYLLTYLLGWVGWHTAIIPTIITAIYNRGDRVAPCIRL